AEVRAPDPRGGQGVAGGRGRDAAQRLEGAHEDRPTPAHGPAGLRGETVVLARRLRSAGALGQERRGRPAAVAIEVRAGAVHGVRAALAREIYDGAGRVARLRGERAGLHLGLGERLRSTRDGGTTHNAGG